MVPYRWLVTGASAGQGLEITLAALHAGHLVLATARNVAKAQEQHPEVEERGGKWLALDVTQDDAEEVVQRAVRDFEINVLVNNAGYGLRGVLEDLRYVSHPSGEEREELIDPQHEANPRTNGNQLLRRPSRDQRRHPLLPTTAARHNRHDIFRLRSDRHT